MHATIEQHIERFFVEVDREQIWHEAFVSRDALIRDILSGQFDGKHSAISTIWHASSDEPLKDVTREIAEIVLNKAEPDLDDDGVPTFGHLHEWLEGFFGVRTVAECAHGGAA